MKRLLLAAWVVAPLLPAIAFGQIGNIVVTSGASFQPALPPKDSNGTLFCTGLRVSGIVGATGTPLPTSLAGVIVTVGGVAAPLFAVADLGGYQQINFQVPVPPSGVLGRFLPDREYPVWRLPTRRRLCPGHAGKPCNGGRDNHRICDRSSVRRPPVPLGQPAPLSPLSHVPQVDVDTTGTFADQLGISVNYSILVMDKPPISGDTTGQLPIPFMGLAPWAGGRLPDQLRLP